MNVISAARLFVAGALFVSPITASATSQQPAAASPTAEGAAKNSAPEEKKICKQLPSSTSRLPQRVCLTAKQWKQIDEEN